MSESGYWWLALGLGLVVAVVAVVLLQTFLKQVYRIESGAEAVWAAGQEVARNTSTTWMLGTTSQQLDLLTTEAGRHAALLSGAPDPQGAAR